jgi:Fe2+ transport system protein B
MTINTKILGKFGIVLGIGAMAYSLYNDIRIDKIAKNINVSVKELSDRTNVYVSDAMVEKAVDRAVERATTKAVADARYRAEKRIENDIHKQVKEAMDGLYSDFKKSVSTEMTRQAAAINMNELKAEVVEKAKEAAMEKFDDNLDDILDKFNSELNNVSKIYSSIADNFTKTKKNDEGYTFRIG